MRAGLLGGTMTVRSGGTNGTVLEFMVALDA